MQPFHREGRLHAVTEKRLSRIHCPRGLAVPTLQGSLLQTLQSLSTYTGAVPKSMIPADECPPQHTGNLRLFQTQPALAS